MDSSKGQNKDVSTANAPHRPWSHATNMDPKTEKEFTIQPITENKGVDPKFAAHSANPGPAIAQNMPAQEGSKEERQARKDALNK